MTAVMCPGMRAGEGSERGSRHSSDAPPPKHPAFLRRPFQIPKLLPSDGASGRATWQSKPDTDPEGQGAAGYRFRGGLDMGPQTADATADCRCCSVPARPEYHPSRSEIVEHPGHGHVLLQSGGFWAVEGH